jgi:hypothetical protein
MQVGGSQVGRASAASGGHHADVELGTAVPGVAVPGGGQAEDEVRAGAGARSRRPLAAPARRMGQCFAVARCVADEEGVGVGFPVGDGVALAPALLAPALLAPALLAAGRGVVAAEPGAAGAE